MKLVVQRVTGAKVTNKKTNKIVGEIGQGLFLLVGVGKGDTPEMARNLASRILKLRIMGDENDKMNLSVTDTKTSVLVVSQFTLYADTSGGNRPSFVSSEEPEKARQLYELFVEELKKAGIVVETGSFGEYMQIDARMDGPVTILY